MSQSQFLNLRRALYGSGDYKLSNESIWHDKDLDEEQRKIDKQLSFTLPSESDENFVGSTNCYLKLKSKRVKGNVKKMWQKEQQQLSISEIV